MNPIPPPPGIPFAEFMADALYDAADGYYAANIKTVGRGGDFSTSATLHAALGIAIGSWLLSESKRARSVRDVIEIGPGDGSLMAEVRRRRGWLRRFPFRYHLVEASPVLRAIQKKRFGSAVRHHADIHSALKAAGGRAFIYANEVVDAFPATLLQWDAPASAWREVFVAKEIVVRELTRPFDAAGMPGSVPSALAKWHTASPPPHAEQRVEIHYSYRDWLRSWSPALLEGAVLTIDYGDRFPEVYHRRPRGTVRGYFSHLVREGSEVYQRPGRQDITADVNFTDLDRWHRECGWETDPLTTQAEFIRRFAFGNRKRVSRKLAETAALAQVLLDRGAGGAFKVHTSRVPL